MGCAAGLLAMAVLGAMSLLLSLLVFYVAIGLVPRS